MLYEVHEVIGSDLPIYKKKDIDHYTLDDILNTNQKLEDFFRCGFVEISKYNRTLYQPIYKMRGDK